MHHDGNFIGTPLCSSLMIISRNYVLGVQENNRKELCVKEACVEVGFYMYVNAKRKLNGCDWIGVNAVDWVNDKWCEISRDYMVSMRYDVKRIRAS